VVTIESDKQASSVSTASAKERRRSVRVGVNLPITLSAPGPDGDEQYRGRLLDLSDQALRCLLRVDPEQVTGRLEEGLSVVAAFTLGRRRFAVPGEIWWRQLSEESDQGVQRIVRFNSPFAESATLYREIRLELTRQQRLAQGR